MPARKSSAIAGPCSGSARMDSKRLAIRSCSPFSMSCSQWSAWTTRMPGRPAQYRRLGAVGLKVMVCAPNLIGRRRASVCTAILAGTASERPRSLAAVRPDVAEQDRYWKAHSQTPTESMVKAFRNSPLKIWNGEDLYGQYYGMILLYLGIIIFFSMILVFVSDLILQQ